MNNGVLNAGETEDHGLRRKKAEQVVNLGLAGNAFLAIGKLGAGIVGHSQALLADGINSISDVVYFLVVKFFVRLSGKPADPEHPYGHYQYETIAALVVGAFVVTTGVAIFWDSINAAFDLVTGKTAAVAIRSYTLWVAAGTIIVKAALLMQAKIVGRSMHNLAVIAIARDHRNDIFASLGVGAGIVFTLLGVGWADPVAGAIVAIIVAKTGFGILREASDELMDTLPGDEISKQIRTALSDEKDIREVEEIHAHRFGPYLVVNITIRVDGSLRVSDTDRIATAAEKKLLAGIAMLRKAYIHCHPDPDQS